MPKLRFPSIESRPRTVLPGVYWPGHELCFFLHDAMARTLDSAMKAGAFHVKFDLKEGELEQLENCEDVFQWLDRYRSPEERTAVMVAGIFPAILSDMLHCIYEALETSRKSKLNVSYMLLRKPIQESLYVLEAVIADRADFAKKLTEDPIKLWSQGVGGRQAHTDNIARTLTAVGNDGRFDASYLAQLRYDKAAEDGFDGICNKAMHLFTSHKAIATEPMNINFIFSNWESKETQWSFLYTRLPYVLAYTHKIVETLCAQIAPSYPEYLEYIQRRLAAHVILWGATLGEGYATGPLMLFVQKHREWLIGDCKAHGYRPPNFGDLARMIHTGAFPGESLMWKVQTRRSITGSNRGRLRRRDLDRSCRCRRLIAADLALSPAVVLHQTPRDKLHPSTSTKKISLNGSDTTTGGSIIMPIDISTEATTRSMIRTSRNSRKPISKARFSCEHARRAD